MGAEYQFLCERCGYEAMVSGGDDAGMMVSTTTVLCENCKELYDVVTSRRPMDLTDQPDFAPVELRCPKSKRHTVGRWEHPGPCPKCGQEMSMGDLMMLWD